MRSNRSNIGLADILVSRIMFLVRAVNLSISYAIVTYPVIDNWYDILLLKGGARTEVKIRLRRANSRRRGISSYALRLRKLLLPSRGTFESIGNGICSVDYLGKTVRFSYANGKQLLDVVQLVTDQFMLDQYQWLKPNGKEIVDIGACIGDTAIYFAMNGARHVYSFEPYPYSFRIARKNIRLNGMSNRITLLNEGCGARNCTIAVNEGFESDELSSIRDFGKGKRISMVTLEGIVKRYGLEDALLKIDCEGSEYGIIIGADKGTLRKFSKMMIEYHNGYRNLKEKLESAGFSVSVEPPTYLANRKVYFGFLFARRI
ncbi:MAG: FkbM family methyltransferase [Candidatus Micrarchaeota archaeon]|nr:FkbM family methyltransferase [Candidatus Micrarchaeota archaeon]